MKLYDVKLTYTEIGESSDEVITSASSVAIFLKPLFREYVQQEQMRVVMLDGGNHIIGQTLITLGLVNQTQAHVRELFRPAIIAGAVSVIIAHNHPSESLVASKEDIETTKRVVEAGKLLDIPVLDHLIITMNNGFTSIKGRNPSIFE